MQLRLEQISLDVNGQTYLYPMSLDLPDNAMVVLLGATQAGKTSLMRLMAGLDRPSSGQIWNDDRNVTDLPVQQRQVAMVYQQFINYPSKTVFENIASPLRLRGDLQIESKVNALAQRLHIEAFLQRLPAELSGGQQQRVALARALAKQAPLMLLDEPLVNLDYKLREELREELTQFFSRSESTIVYATTEPSEALMLGGHTVVLDQGELLQHGPTLDLFYRPANIRVARALSDPPINTIHAEQQADGLLLAGSHGCSLKVAQNPDPNLLLGLRANCLHLQPQPGFTEIASRVELSEISGSDTYLHLSTSIGGLVMHLNGVHKFESGVMLAVYFNPQDALVFNSQGNLIQAAGNHPRNKA